jgi:transcriptional regulator with PAS, ATPase and Fis domain
VKANCAVFSEGVLESEIFGHERGSFTGAHARKPGRFELADGGTMFLDEVSDLPPVVQVKLLRVLQEREFERVGGTVPVKVDVRLIAATNRDLKEMVRAGKFREDLFFRLNVVSIVLPPLRDREEDIPALAQHFVERYRADARKGIKGISQAALDLLRKYPWPGNVRELENVVQRALVLADGDSIETRDLPADIRLGESAFVQGGEAAARSREENEKTSIVEALKLERGNRSRAAARLSLNRTTLLYKMKKYGLIQ